MVIKGLAAPLPLPSERSDPALLCRQVRGRVGGGRGLVRFRRSGVGVGVSLTFRPRGSRCSCGSRWEHADVLSWGMEVGAAGCSAVSSAWSTFFTPNPRGDGTV